MISLRQATRKSALGVLYRIERNRSHREWKRNIGISNTVAWNPNRTRFYFGDTLANTIFIYDYDPGSGEISRERPFLKDFELGVPDESTVDSEGYLWNCRSHAGCVIRVCPDGKLAEVHRLPVRKPTTCTFGAQDLSTLYVTSAYSDDRKRQSNPEVVLIGWVVFQAEGVSWSSWVAGKLASRGRT
jgi:sugar lactone lactonase YvrE